MNPRKFLYDFRGFSHHSIVPKATDFFAAFTILAIVRQRNRKKIVNETILIAPGTDVA